MYDNFSCSRKTQVHLSLYLSLAYATFVHKHLKAKVLHKNKIYSLAIAAKKW